MKIKRDNGKYETIQYFKGFNKIRGVSSMVVNCSESGLKAMTKQCWTDLGVVHTVDGLWKMKHYPIEVTHARQRP